MSTDDGVHQSHCCSRHGCKYGDTEWNQDLLDWVDSDCPVANDRVKQEGPCFYCIDPNEARQEIEHLQNEIAFVEGLYKTNEIG